MRSRSASTPGVDLTRRDGELVDLLERDRDGVVAVKGYAAGGTLVHDDTQRVDIRGGAEVLAAGLLGAYIVGGAQHVVIRVRWLFLARAMPKSMTLMLPSGSTMMFCGLMSRWMISCLCATESAELICEPICATFLGSRRRGS